MSGPCSYPAQDKRVWEEMNEIVCDVHFKCEMAAVDKNGNAIKHDYITYRTWLLRRNKLRTGKTL